MSKQKIIDVWVEKSITDDDRCNVYPMCYSDALCTDNFYKGKIIIELPEKKIEITESQFDETWARHISCHEGMTNNSYRESFKNELGFSDE